MADKPPVPVTTLIELSCSASDLKNFRSKVQEDLDTTENTGKPVHFKSVFRGNTVLPPLAEFPKDFVESVNSQIIDVSMKDELEQSQVINWCRTAKPVFPLKTRGDGNCLLHALSLFLWAFEDTEMFLRRVLYVTLLGDLQGSFKQRWRHERGYISDSTPSLRIDTVDWEKEWDVVLKLGDDTPQNRPNDLTYSSLEEIHLFVMANILKRPVIVLCDQVFRGVYGNSLQPNNFGGIYLPLLWEPKQCCKHPILLGYSMSHFMPLVGEAEPYRDTCTTPQAEHVVPLVHHDQTPLKLHFLLPQEESRAMVLLRDYLKLSEAVMTGVGGVSQILAARLNKESPPEHVNIMKFFIQGAERSYTKRLRALNSPHSVVGQENHYQMGKTLEITGEKCITEDCSMTGSASTGNMCSKCFLEFTKRDAEMEAKKHQAPKVPTAPLIRVEPLDERKFVPCEVPLRPKHMFDQNVKYSTSESPTCVSPQCKKPAVSYSLCMRCIEALQKGKRNSKNSASLRKSTDQSELFGSGRSVSITSGTIPCVTRGCNGTGKEQQQSMCTNCFLRSPQPLTSFAGLTNTSTEPHKPTEGALAFLETGTNTAPTLRQKPYVHNVILHPSPQVKVPELIVSQEDDVTKRICSTPGCLGLRIKNPHGMCNSCFDSTKRKQLPEPNKEPEETVEPLGSRTSNRNSSTDTRSLAGSGHLVESLSEPISSPVIIFSEKQRRKCVSPVCENQIFPPKELCESCVQILAEATVKDTHEELCRKQGCDFHGAPKFDGYCSKCFEDLRRGSANRNSTPRYEDQGARQNSAPIRSALDVQVEERSYSAPIFAKGKRCKTPSCSLYGDPAMDDLCTGCYQRSLSRTRTSGGYSSPQPPYEALYKAGSHREKVRGGLLTGNYSPGVNLPPRCELVTSETSNFEENMRRLEMGNKSERCRNARRGCPNFGGVSRNGLCSVCFNMMNGEDVIDGLSVM